MLGSQISRLGNVEILKAFSMRKSLLYISLERSIQSQQDEIRSPRHEFSSETNLLLNRSKLIKLHLFFLNKNNIGRHLISVAFHLCQILQRVLLPEKNNFTEQGQVQG